jgi:hypothetical protein
VIEIEYVLTGRWPTCRPHGSRWPCAQCHAPASAEGYLALVALADSLVAQTHRAWGALDAGERAKVHVALAAYHAKEDDRGASTPVTTESKP